MLPRKIEMILTTNLRFGEWNAIFGNETMTTALLDRLTGKGHILEFIGESYRFRQRLRQEEQQRLEEKAATG
jgi:DNA replication protein DnaC